MEWEGKMTAEFLLGKLDVLAQLYRLGPVDKEGNLGCEKDCYAVTPQEIIRETFKIIEVSDLTPMDRKALKWKGAIEKYKDTFWSELAMEANTRRSLGFLDLAFQRIASDETSLSGSITAHFFTLAKKYYDTETAVGNFLFAPRKEVRSVIQSNYQSYIQ